MSNDKFVPHVGWPSRHAGGFVNAVLKLNSWSDHK
jgi:hypothetical protein